MLHTSEKVQSWRVLPSGQVEVTTDRGRYTTDKLVLTAGAWMPEVVPELKVKPNIAKELIVPVSNVPHHATPTPLLARLLAVQLPGQCIFITVTVSVSLLKSMQNLQKESRMAKFTA